jgi:hypothetical protein
MTLASLSLPGTSLTQGLRLSPYAVARPALTSHVRPALVLGDGETRDLLDAAQRADVAHGGHFQASPAGIQVWDRPWDGPGGTPGNAVHLGTVDWALDTPMRHYSTIYRALVTQAGLDRGESPVTVLYAVLGLSGIAIDGSQVTEPAPPPRDPFRAGRLAG